jgi:hypothetical protein
MKTFPQVSAPAVLGGSRLMLSVELRQFKTLSLPAGFRLRASPQ